MKLNLWAAIRVLALPLALGTPAGLAVGVAQAQSPALELVGIAGQVTLDLSLEDLGKMPQVTIVTANEFSDGMVSYRGPLVRDVLDRVGLGGLETVRFVAANDYFVEIPTSDFQNYDAILAMEADGKPLSRREKGPLWLMYPISEHAELQDPEYLRRLIWQVVRIEAP